MSKNTKLAKTKLLLDISYDYFTIAICSHARDYQLCWNLNKSLDFDFVKNSNLLVIEKEEEYSFPMYSYFDEENEITYYIVANKSEGNVLVKKQKQVDYFLILEGAYDFVNIEEIVRKIQNCKQVLLAFECCNDDLNVIENLLFN